MTLTSPLRRHSLAGAGKSFDIAEQHGHDATLPVDGKHRPVDQSLDDTRVDVLAERLAHPLLVAQLLDHPVEGGGQVADLVL